MPDDEATHAPSDRRDLFRGCLLAGAVGDALGAPVEFWSLAEIRSRLGSEGVVGYIEDPLITDDTQMTLFTAEGMIRASVRGRSRGITDTKSVVHHAYLRWLHTQGYPWDAIGAAHRGDPPDGWLVGERRLHHRRAPGNTCLSGLRSGACGTVDKPLNDSKGCGGVMRAAPVGLFVADPAEAFRVGCATAAITHGHPDGWLPAGALAAIVALVIDGTDLAAAVEKSRRLVAGHARHEGTLAAIDAAVALADSGLPEPEQLESLGGAWVGEEALAIALCCSLAEPDLRRSLLASVNHSGDSDSTGAICGNILGAMQGLSAVPKEWIEPLDVGDIVSRVADDLWTERFEPPAIDAGGGTPFWWDRYPGG